MRNIVKNTAMNITSIDRRVRFLFGKKKENKHIRPGAMKPEEVKSLIASLGTSKKVSIRRIDSMGEPEDEPLEVMIVGIFEESFLARVVNPERKIMEAADAQKVYIKGGGGTIEFNYNDGDIKEIIVDIDESIIEELDTDMARQIIEALEEGDEIRVSYFDNFEKTAVNCIGSLLKKISDTHFIVLATKINTVKLANPHEIELDLKKTPIMDIQII